MAAPDVGMPDVESAQQPLLEPSGDAGRRDVFRRAATQVCAERSSAHAGCASNCMYAPPSRGVNLLGSNRFPHGAFISESLDAW